MERNYGLDALRMLSMLMVVILHVIAQGGVMVRISGSERTYYAVWFIETCAYCAVDCYGLLSGYVGVNAKFRPARIIELWLQVFFYSAGITLIFQIVSPGSVTFDNWLQAVFPVGWKTYWYFSAYAALFFMMPFLNKMVFALTEKERKLLLTALVVIFSVSTALPKVNRSDYLQLVGGYSFVWLLVLYLIGACLKTICFRKRTVRFYVAVYFISSAIAWLSKILIENTTRELLGEALFGRILTSYTAPTILLCAVCLLLAADSCVIRSKRVIGAIKLLSPLAFSVYLIHTQPMVWEYILKNAFAAYRYLNPPAVMAAIIATAVGIYCLCSLIDFGRSILFRVLHVRMRCEKLETVLRRRLMREP